SLGQRLVGDRRGQGPGRVEQPPGAGVRAEQRLDRFAKGLVTATGGLQVRGSPLGRGDLERLEEDRLLAYLMFDHRSLAGSAMVWFGRMQCVIRAKSTTGVFPISEGPVGSRASDHSPSPSSRLSQARA